MKELWVILKDFVGNKSIDKSTFKTIRTLLGSFALYATIVVAVALLIYSIVIRNRDEVQLAKSRRTMVGIVIGYSVGVIAILGFLEISYQIWSGDINNYYWMFFGLIALVAIGIVVTLVLKNKRIGWYKWLALGFAVAFVVYSIVIACVVPAIDESFEPLNGQNWQMTVVTVVLVAVIVALSVLGGKKDDGYDARSLTYGAICVSLAYALSYIKFFSLPQGGSVTFASMLPIILYSYIFGTRKGLVVGVVYGMLQFIQSPQFYQPMQALLDYPIAFGALGVAGIARKIPFIKGKMLAEFAVGATIAIVLRYFSHVVSGYYVFSSWAMDGYTAVSWAFVYNAFVFADLAIVLVIGLVALSTKTLRRTILQVQH